MDWLQLHPAVAWWTFALSAAMFVGSLLVLPVLLARMPADYFLRPRTLPGRGRRHPLVHLAWRILKNVTGALLVTAGAVMLIAPGQGVLTLLVGLSLMDLPGKRRLELALIRPSHVQQAINWIRAKANRPPLIVPPREG